MNQCIFHDVAESRRDRTLFDIVERGYNGNEKVLVYAPSEARAAELDRMLWIVKQESFIPHTICRPRDPDPKVPVAIVTEEIDPVEARVLIADGHCSIEFACGFDSVHEFVDRSSPEMHQTCRDRYRAYRDRKLPVEHIKE